MSPVFACFDVETTGLDATTSRVIEIAVVRVTAEGDELGEWTSLVDAGTRDLGRPDIHGISPEWLQGAPVFGDLAGDLAGELAGCVPVAHNAGFDVRFLATEWERANLGPLDLVALDTLDMARRLGLPGRLGALAAALDVPLVDAHQALDDTRALAGVLIHLLARSGLPATLPRFDPPLLTPPRSGRTQSRPAT